MARGAVFNLATAISRGIRLGLKDNAYRKPVEQEVVAALRYGSANVVFDRKTKKNIVGHDTTGKLSNSIKARMSSVKKVGATPRGDGVSTFNVRFNIGMAEYGWDLEKGGSYAGRATTDEIVEWIQRKKPQASGIRDPKAYWRAFAKNIINKHLTEGVEGTNWLAYGMNMYQGDFVDTDTLQDYVNTQVDLELGRLFDAVNGKTIK